MKLGCYSPTGAGRWRNWELFPLMLAFQKDGSRTYLQKRNRLTDIESKLMVTKGEREWGGGRNKVGVWD